MEACSYKRVYFVRFVGPSGAELWRFVRQISSEFSACCLLGHVVARSGFCWVMSEGSWRTLDFDVSCDESRPFNLHFKVWLVSVGDCMAELWAPKQGSNYVTFSRPLQLVNMGFFWAWKLPHTPTTQGLMAKIDTTSFPKLRQVLVKFGADTTKHVGGDTLCNRISRIINFLKSHLMFRCENRGFWLFWGIIGGHCRYEFDFPRTKPAVQTCTLRCNCIISISLCCSWQRFEVQKDCSELNKTD